MIELDKQIATQLRAAADRVELSAGRDGFTDNFHDEGDETVLVSIHAMKELRNALKRCLGKSMFYINESMPTKES